MLISWPAGIKAHGELRHQFLHATDILPTVYDLLGIELPRVVNGYPQLPLEGVSVRATFDSDDMPTPKQSAFFSMLGSRAVWHQGWKAVSVHPTIAGWGHFEQDRWELYNTVEDPTESHDLAADNPGKVHEMINQWYLLAGMYQGLPLNDKSMAELLVQDRPQVTPAREHYVYYPDAAEVPEAAAVNIRNRSYTISVQAHIDTDDASGVLFSHGARFGGHALYVKDGTLKYVYNFVGSKVQTIEASRPVPTGNVVLSAAFVKEGDAMPTTGTLALYINDDKVGEGRIITQPGTFSLAGEGLNIGKDPASPITEDYPGTTPYPFTGGTIKQAIVDVSGRPFVDVEREAVAVLARE